MIAQAPAPLAASTTPAAPPMTTPMAGIISTRRKSMSRSISICWVAPRALMTKVAESAASSGCASGWP